MGEAKYIQPVLGDTKKLLLKKNEAAGITRKLDVTAAAEAPVAKGQELGTLTVYSSAGESCLQFRSSPGRLWTDSAGDRWYAKYLRLLFTGNK
jgi:hypothetical protein